jgi:membrane protease YdiL (CAAX protease family)
MYRGAGMTLLARFGTPIAVLVTAIGFGLGHGLLLALAALVYFGLVMAVLRLKTRSVYPCMLVHCAFNATSLILAVTT